MTEPKLSVVETAFLRRWETTDFTTWNEQEVREEFIVQILHLLGYRKGSTHDIEMEKPLTLSEPYHRVGRKRVAIDYAPSLRLRYFWIIEAKPGNQAPMQFEDVLQAHLYAIHPEIQARFIVLCNGQELRVYDALTLKDFDDALLVVDQRECFKKFDELRTMLGARSMLSFQRKRLLDIAGKTLDVEVDIDAFRDFRAGVNAVLRDAETRIRANERALRSQQFRRWHEEEEKELREASLEVLFVRMDLPDDGRPPPVNEFVRRVLAGDAAERQRLVDKLAMHYRGRPHNIFRGLAAGVLARLVEEGVEVGRSSYVHGVVASLEELVRANAGYWASSLVVNALCHLDNAAMRVAYKFCTRLAMPFMTKLTEEAKVGMTPEDRIAKNPTTARLMIPSVGHAQEALWRKWCSKDGVGVLAGLWTLQAVETELDQLAEAKYPDGDSDLLFFEHQGRGCDQLRGATRNGLNRRVEALRKAGVAADVIQFGEQSWEDLNKTCPPEPTAPGDWLDVKMDLDIEGVGRWANTVPVFTRPKGDKSTKEPTELAADFLMPPPGAVVTRGTVLSTHQLTTQAEIQRKTVPQLGAAPRELVVFDNGACETRYQMKPPQLWASVASALEAHKVKATDFDPPVPLPST